MKHYVTGGVFGMHFINTWSNVARDLGINMLIIIDRTVPCARNPPQPSFDHVEYKPGPKANTSHESPLDGNMDAIFKILEDHINMLN